MKLRYVVVLFCVLLLVGSVVQAQNARLRTFPLHKEFVAQVIACDKQEDAVMLADASAESIEKASLLFQAFALLDVCGAGVVPITYLERVHSGAGMNVYRARIGGKMFYVATDWTHESL